MREVSVEQSGQESISKGKVEGGHWGSWELGEVLERERVRPPSSQRCTCPHTARLSLYPALHCPALTHMLLLWAKNNESFYCSLFYMKGLLFCWKVSKSSGHEGRSQILQEEDGFCKPLNTNLCLPRPCCWQTQAPGLFLTPRTSSETLAGPGDQRELETCWFSTTSF